jgi:hypothetical protein
MDEFGSSTALLVRHIDFSEAAAGGLFVVREYARHTNTALKAAQAVLHRRSIRVSVFVIRQDRSRHKHYNTR